VSFSLLMRRAAGFLALTSGRLGCAVLAALLCQLPGVAGEIDVRLGLPPVPWTGADAPSPARIALGENCFSIRASAAMTV
jgi:hypothetical protein